jgi:hypothetical protein
MLTLNDAKAYCRATDEDDVLVQQLMDASESYLEGAVDDYTIKYANCGTSWQAKADLARKLLVADWYENRLATERPVSPAIRLLLVQLQHTATHTGGE